MRSLEEDTQALINVISATWEAEWNKADWSLAFVSQVPRDYLKQVCQAAGVSHQEVERWAQTARMVPPSMRSEDLSPRYQLHLAKKNARARRLA